MDVKFEATFLTLWFGKTGSLPLLIVDLSLVMPSGYWYMFKLQTSQDLKSVLRSQDNGLHVRCEVLEGRAELGLQVAIINTSRA